jgi:hypothetical protein
MRLHAARWSVALLACTGAVAAAAAIPHGRPAVLVVQARHASPPPSPSAPAPATVASPVPGTPPAVPTAQPETTAPPPEATPRSHPSHERIAAPTVEPGIPPLPVPTAIVVPVGPPPALPAPVAGITVPTLPTLPALPITATPIPSPVAESPWSPARVPAAAVVTGGGHGPGPLALSGVLLAAGFIGAVSLVDHRRRALAGTETAGPAEEPRGS